MKKQNVRRALAVVSLSLFTAFVWRYIGVYFSFVGNKFETVTAECVSTSWEQANGKTHKSPRVYCLHLQNGITVCVERKVINDVFSSVEEMNQQLLTGKTLQITYVANPAIVETQFLTAYALVSVYNGEQVVISSTDSFLYYSGYFHTLVIVDAIFYGVAVLELVSPAVFKAIRGLKKRRKKALRRRKKRNRQKFS